MASGRKVTFFVAFLVILSIVMLFYIFECRVDVEFELFRRGGERAFKIKRLVFK